MVYPPSILFVAILSSEDNELSANLDRYLLFICFITEKALSHLYVDLNMEDVNAAYSDLHLARRRSPRPLVSRQLVNLALDEQQSRIRKVEKSMKGKVKKAKKKILIESDE